MTPKEKAIGLFNKYAKKRHHTTADVKYYCTIVCDEVIAALDKMDDKLYEHEGVKLGDSEYWQSVKEEIKSL